GEHDARPVLLFGGELFEAGRRDLVILRAASFGRFAPGAGDVAILFEPMERREQRAGLDEERAARNLLDTIGHADAVSRLERESFEDEQIERPLHQFGLLLRHAAVASRINIERRYWQAAE